MAEIVFVTPASGQASVTPAPSALGLLNHNVHPVVGGDQAIAFPASSAILIVDARSDLAAARATAEPYTLPRMAEALLTLYGQLLPPAAH